MQRNILIAISLLALALPVLFGLSAAQAEDFVYWADAVQSKIQRASVDDGIVEDIVVLPPGSSPSGIALDLVDGKIYWSQQSTTAPYVQRSNLDGTSVEQLLSGITSPAIALDLTNRKLYVHDVFINGKAFRSNLDGTNLEELNIHPQDREGIAVDSAGGKLYLANRSGLQGKIERANLDGSDLGTLISGLTDPRQIGLDLDTGKIYWADAIKGKIQRANLDGTGEVEDLVTNLGFIIGLALDLQKGKIYWSHPGANKIQRANLDGSSIEDVVNGIRLPTQIALQLGDPTLTVAIDFLPGSDANVVNLGAAGVVPVAILSSETFDATMIDPSTVFVTSAPVKLAGKSGDFLCQDRDVNGDGILDMVCEVEISYFILEEGDGVVMLEASTFDGQPVQGTDVVHVVP